MTRSRPRYSRGWTAFGVIGTVISLPVGLALLLWFLLTDAVSGPASGQIGEAQLGQLVLGQPRVYVEWVVGRPPAESPTAELPAAPTGVDCVLYNEYPPDRRQLMAVSEGRPDVVRLCYRNDYLVFKGMFDYFRGDGCGPGQTAVAALPAPLPCRP